jgi:Acetoacetate decarboxylase (ADC)
MTTTATVAGETVTFPVEVRDARSWFASFLVSADAMRNLLEPTGLQPALAFRGKALLSLAFVRYNDSDLGPYQEVAIAPLVRGPGSSSTKPAGAYIHQLPVNQAFTCEAGRALWGFPKFLADITIAEGRRSTVCTLRHDGQHVLTLGLRNGVPGPMRDTALDAYSFLHGRLRRTKWALGGSGSRIRPAGATLTLGEHPIARELAGLGLPRAALMTGCVASVHMEFGEAEDVAPAEISS